MAKDTEISAREAGLAIIAAAQAKIEKFAEELNRLQKMEETVALGKSIGGLPSSTPSSKAVADGDMTAQHAPTRTVFKILALKKAEKAQKAETFLDNDNLSDHDKRFVEKGKPKGNLPPQLEGNWAGKNDSKPEAEKEAPGSGGLKKDEAVPSAKPAQPPKPPTAGAVKPAGVPAAKAGTAPSVPKPPSAPGSTGSTMKSEVGIFKKLKLKQTQGK
jgi:hypothetical protein